MANLRQRLVREILLESLSDEEDFGGNESEEEENSEFEHEDDEDEDEDEEDEDDELENELQESRVTKKMRLREERENELDDVPLAQRARGRPVTKLYRKGVGKNRFFCSINQASPESERMNPPLPEYIPGPINEAANCNTIYEFWNVLFNDEMINIIVECTNEKIENKCAIMIAQGKEVFSYEHHTEAKEIKAFIAILYHSGMWKTNRVDVKRLWNHGNGILFYRCVMPCRRFWFLSENLRFDIKATRNREDRLAPIRKLWEIFINNCSKNYNPSSMCTVDEQLHGFKGRCKHRVYMKSKRDKYGLMEKSLNDALTGYLIFAIPYLGKTHGLSKNESVPEYFFREVTTPIHGTNRTVTIDNWFTTIPLLLKMLEEPYNLTITGTIRKNRREIPDEMRVASKTVPDAKFCFDEKITLLSYTPKKNKFVLLASTFTSTTAITDGKPDMILHYNKTKGGTDTYDQLCHAFTTARRTKRWSLRHFFGILDQAIVNARILFTCKQINEGKRIKVTPQQCFEDVIEQLSKSYLQERYEIPTLQKSIKYGIAAILGLETVPTGENVIISAENYARCSFCNRKKNDRKTKTRCGSCLRPMCNDHRVGICIECGCLQ